MRILFQRFFTAVLLGFVFSAPTISAGSVMACNPVEQHGVVGQSVHFDVSGDNEGFHVTAPGSSSLTRGETSVVIHYTNEGFFPITVWNDSGERSVCYTRIRMLPTSDGVLGSSVRAVVADSLSLPVPSISAMTSNISARIAAFVDVSMVPLIILLASISALLFVGYNGSAVFRRRRRLGNIDVVRPPRIDLKK